MAVPLCCPRDRDPVIELSRDSADDFPGSGAIGIVKI
jgi:hypothetical protein